MSGASSSHNSTFHRFPALPPELRLRIWHFAVHIPHVFTLQTPKCDPIRLAGAKSIHASPISRPLLLVSVEARKAARSKYLPGFYDESARKIVWINPKVDTLYLNGISVYLFGKYEIAKHVERLAFAIEDWEWLEDPILRAYYLQQIRFLCRRMAALKEVQFVICDERKRPQTANGPIAPWFLSTPCQKAWDTRLYALPKPSMRTREKTLEDFQQVMEETRHEMGIWAAQTSVTVRPVALGISGDESNWSRNLELTYRNQPYISGVQRREG